MDWRLLVKERITNIGISLDFFRFFDLMTFCLLNFFCNFLSYILVNIIVKKNRHNVDVADAKEEKETSRAV